MTIMRKGPFCDIVNAVSYFLIFSESVKFFNNWSLKPTLNTMIKTFCYSTNKF